MTDSVRRIRELGCCACIVEPIFDFSPCPTLSLAWNLRVLESEVELGFLLSMSGTAMLFVRKGTGPSV